MNFTKELLKKGYLMESSLTKIFETLDLNLVTEILAELNAPKLVSKNFLLANIEKISYSLSKKGVDENLKKKFLEDLEKFLGIKKLEEEKEEKINDIEIKKYLFEPRKIEVRDFVEYFKTRLWNLKLFIQEKGLENLTSIGKLPFYKRKVSVIGIVYSKKKTRNKNVVVELEDFTGRVRAIISKERKELVEKAEQIVEDEVIGITGFGNSDVIFATEIFFPDIGKKRKKRCPKEIYAAFISDIHVGSNKFLEKNFLHFIDWLNGNVGTEKQREMASKLKYLFVVGDTVDGVGVYPNQDKELSILDVFEQYKKLAKLLGKIRKDVKIILCPGNLHDAVPRFEPQPPIPKEVAPDLYKLENVFLVSNPALVKIAKMKNFDGFDVLLYHGDSYDYYADSVDALRLANARKKPETIIHFLLRKRHLAPTYGSALIVPSKQDPLLIRNVPDIFVSGHLHRSAVSEYNNIITISCSCWQSKTPYQEKLGHEPDFCKVPIINLKTRKIKVMDFS